MPANAYLEPDQMDLQLDLLVDAELTEDQRHALLLALDRDPTGKTWRELAIRFLQRQVERESVKQLMNGGSVIPVDWTPAATPPKRLAIADWLGTPGTLAIAAGLLIAVASATLTFYVMKPAAPASSQDEQLVSLPGQSMGVSDAVPVSLHVVNDSRKERSDFFFADQSQRTGGNVAKRSVVIKPDSDGNAMIIPVNTMTMKVY